MNNLNDRLTIQMQKEINKIQSILNEQGLKLKLTRDVEFITHTFQLEVNLLNKFFELQKAKKIKIKEAINDALRLYVENK